MVKINICAIFISAVNEYVMSFEASTVFYTLFFLSPNPAEFFFNLMHRK